MSDKKYDIETLWVLGKIDDEYWEKESLEGFADNIKKLVDAGVNKKLIIEVVQDIINIAMIQEWQD